MFFKDRPIEELFYTQLQKEIGKSSHGRIGKARRQMIAANFVKHFDFSNPVAQHKSVQGWADILAQSYLSKV